MFPKSNSSYNLRNTSEFKRPMVNTVVRGTETFSNIGSQILGLTSFRYKNITYTCIIQRKCETMETS